MGDALEEAAGLKEASSPQGKAAADLRSSVADARYEEPPKKPKKKMGGFAEVVDEIPDIEEKEEAEEEEAAAEEKKAVGSDLDLGDPPELNLNPKQNGLRTDLEMWVMDEIPVLFRVDDSEDLDESLQEDFQADIVTHLVARDEEERQQLLDSWLKTAPDADAKEAFCTQVLAKVADIQAAGGE